MISGLEWNESSATALQRTLAVMHLRKAAPVCTENLNPDIVAMKPAKDRA